MATFFRPLCILPLLFATSYAHFLFAPWNFKWLSQKKILGPHELFGNPFGNPDDYKYQHIPNDFDIPRDLFNALNPGNFFNGQGNGNVGANQGSGNSGAGDQGSGNAGANQGSGNSGAGDQGSGNAGANQGSGNAGAGNQGSGNAGAFGQAARKFRGKWELVSKNSGVSAMHAILLPKVNKVLMYDATIWKISNIQLPAGQCRVLNETTKEIDCYAHSILFDIETSELKPLQLHTDTWCSSGGLTLDGNFVSTGGFQKGANTVRYLETCQDCNWREYPNALAAPRWYSTQVELPDGSFIVVGGRDAFSYEYIPPEGKTNAKPFYFDFLRQTSMKEENNLYPFVHLSTDGNVFIFANDRAVLLNPRSNRIVREYPQLPGGHRSYPASGMSILLPITLTSRNPKNIPAEVLICGGSGHEDAYSKAEKQIFYNALRDCGRIKITEKNPVWEREVMPSPRIMGDMLILPNGQVIALNGAVRGASGWGFAREPNFVPVLYTPTANAGKRFRKLAASNIARMYHSSSVLLPDGKVLVGGSNTNNGYIYNAMFPTELRIEKFSPPYLDPAQAGNRPEIVLDQSDNKLAYGKDFKLQIRLQVDNIDKNDIKVTMYAPAFTTHGISMNQRLLILNLEDVRTNGGHHEILAVAPPSGAIAPQGYYMLFVVYKGIPSVSSWVQIK